MFTRRDKAHEGVTLEQIRIKSMGSMGTESGQEFLWTLHPVPNACPCAL
jgi:hypothetical protein